MPSKPKKPKRWPWKWPLIAATLIVLCLDSFIIIYLNLTGTRFRLQSLANTPPWIVGLIFTGAAVFWSIVFILWSTHIRHRNFAGKQL